MLNIILAILLFVNLAAFLTMIIDKQRSRLAGRERISEGMMFFLATIGGSLGIYLGMFAVSHKTRKWYFLVGLPLLLLENLAFAYVLYSLWSGGEPPALEGIDWVIR